MIRCIAVVALFAGCFSEVDIDEVNSDEYTQWYSVVAVGEAPGHGDSYRVMYANDDARSYTGLGAYPAGSIIVKEIYRREGDAMGEFRYIGIMRKLADAPAGGELDGVDPNEFGGWLFTYRGDFDSGAEQHRPRCWRTCHQNAPFEGTFLNWSESNPND